MEYRTQEQYEEIAESTSKSRFNMNQYEWFCREIAGYKKYSVNTAEYVESLYSMRRDVILNKMSTAGRNNQEQAFENWGFIANCINKELRKNGEWNA